MWNHADPSKDVETELSFWRFPEVGNDVQADFTKGNPEQVLRELQTHEETHRVVIHDIRGQESNFTLEQNGFTYLTHEIPELNQVSDEQCLKDIIIPQTEELVRKITGASKTITFASRVRCFVADTSQLANNRAPAHSVHSDFSAVGALHQLTTVVPEDSRPAGRVMIINVWRPLKTIQRDPLAVCDWQTLDMKDSIPNRMTLPTGWNELGRYAFGEGQKWCYLSGQRSDEPLVFTQFDSARVDEGGVTVPHTAFADPMYTENAARESLEIKMFAFV